LALAFVEEAVFLFAMVLSPLESWWFSGRCRLIRNMRSSRYDGQIQSNDLSDESRF
jgi:hypothetical protein